MNLKIISWNLNQHRLDTFLKKSAGNYILSNDFDVILLQELKVYSRLKQKIVNNIKTGYFEYIYEKGHIDDSIISRYQCYFKTCFKDGKKTQYGNAILIKKNISNSIEEIEFLNSPELNKVDGGVMGIKINFKNNDSISIINIYSYWKPIESNLDGWFIARKILIEHFEKSYYKKNSKEWNQHKKLVLYNNINRYDEFPIFLKDIFFNVFLQEDVFFKPDDKIIISGDFNSSTIKDYINVTNEKGHISFINKMYSKGFKESIRELNKNICPTFIDSRRNLIHQIDYCFVRQNVFKNLINCYTVEPSIIFNKINYTDGTFNFYKGISDHLPIILELNSDIVTNLKHSSSKLKLSDEIEKYITLLDNYKKMRLISTEDYEKWKAKFSKKGALLEMIIQTKKFIR